jgi:hypothetical protein
MEEKMKIIPKFFKVIPHKKMDKKKAKTAEELINWMWATDHDGFRERSLKQWSKMKCKIVGLK